MKELSYEECVQRFQSERCDNFELSEDGKTISGLDKIKGALIIPEGVEVIDCKGQVRNERLTAIIMPDSVREMNGFVNGSYTPNINFVRLSSNLHIPDNAFGNCQIEEIIIPEGIKIIPYRAFIGNLSNIDLPSTIEYIVSEAFYNCKISNINIPENTKVIFPLAFGSCSNLKKVTVFSNDTVIMEGAFKECGEKNDSGYSFDEKANKIYEEHKIGNRTFGHGEEKYKIINGEKILLYIPDYYCGKLIIEDGTLDLGFHTLKNCNGVTEIFFPDSMKAFPEHYPMNVKKIRFPQTTECDKLSIWEANNVSEINLPKGIKRLKIVYGSFHKLLIPEGVEKIELSYLKNLKNIILPNSVKELSIFTLPNITDLRIPEGVIKLEIRGVKQLKHIIIPSTVESLLLNGCPNLEEITIPESVKNLNPSYIYETSFRGNKVINSATLMCKINIGDIFRGCTNLKTLTLGAGIKKFDKDFFDTLSGLETIYIPAKKMKYYSSRIPEELHNKIVELPVENRK